MGVPTLTAFAASPDQGQGMARDMPVRWALEETGQSYDVRLVPLDQLGDAAHRSRNPFGQIPTFEDGDLVLFESGAIVLHVAEHGAGLLPAASDPRSRAIMWMFAAVNTLEPPIFERDMADLLDAGEPWAAARMERLDAAVRRRLGELAARLGGEEWLDGAFTAGDLLVICVLRRLHGSGLLAEFPEVAAYVARGEARPAFQRAFAAQARAYAESCGGGAA